MILELIETKYPMEYTEEEYASFKDLSENFSTFVATAGLDSAHSAVESLAGNSTTTLDYADRAYAEAWVAWSLNFKSDQTIVWESTSFDEAVDAGAYVDKHLAALDEKQAVAKQSQRSKSLSEWLNGSRLFYMRGCLVATKGFSANAVILDGLDDVLSASIVEDQQVLVSTIGTKIIEIKPAPDEEPA